MNKCVFYGRLVRDVDLRCSKNGTAVGRFSLAVNRQFQNQEKKTDFLNMTAFGKTAENIEKFFRQGSRIVVCCHAQQEEYTNKDGVNVNTVGFIVDQFDFVDTRAEGGITKNQSPQSAPEQAPEDYSDGFVDIPEGLDSELPFS